MSVEDINPSDITVEADEYNFHLRLREIHVARQEAQNAQDELEDRRVPGSRENKEKYYFYKVKQYVRELEPALRRYYEESEEPKKPNFWTEYDLGPVIINPPGELLDRIGSLNQDLLDSKELDPKNIGHIIGLKDFITAPETFQTAFNVVTKVRHKDEIVVGGRRDAKCSNIGKKAMPASISEEAFAAANRFMAKINLDIPLEKDAAEAYGEYEDILENGYDEG